MKPAARSGDMHLCPAQTPPLPVPHIGGPVLPAPATVLIGGSPAATLGQMCLCTGLPDSIITGSMTVLINNKPAAVWVTVRHTAASLSPECRQY